MDKNRKIIIIALIVVILALTACIGYMLLNPSVEYQTISLSNGTTIEVPVSDNVTWTKDTTGIRIYTDSIHHAVLTSLNSQEDLTLAGAIAYAAVRDAMLNGASDVENYNGYEIKERSINGTHVYMVNIVNNATHDNILLVSENLDILKHMLDSIKFGSPANAATNATMGFTPTVVDANNSDTSFSEDDLRWASEYGYYLGYSDGYDDSYDDYSSSSDSYVSSSSSSSYDYSDDDSGYYESESGVDEYIDEEGNVI